MNRSFFPRALCLALFFSLSSCMISMSKEEQLEKLLPVPSLEASLEEAASSSTFAKGPWPEKAWWTQYGSFELNRLIERGLEKNPSIQAVQERISFAKNEAVIARSQYMPLLYFDASDQWQYLSKNGLYRALNPDLKLSNQQIDFSLSFSYEFDFWGKYHNLYYAALGREQAAIAETEQAKLIVSTGLAQAFFALKTTIAKKSLYESLYEIRRSYFLLQDEMTRSGLYSQLVPLLSEEDLFQAKQWLYQIEQEIALNKHLVNILAGLGPDAPLLLEEPLPELPEALALPQEISADLLSRRPDLMAQIWRVEALAHEVGAAKADFFPNVNLLGLLGFQSNSWASLFEWASKTISALPGLSLPVYTAGAIGANVDAQKALFFEAVYQYNDLILKSFQQVADLIAIGRSVYGERGKQKQIVENASKRYALTLDRQRSGLDSALASYRFAEAEILKKIEDLQLLYQQYVVSVSLIRALGGGYSAEAPL